MVQIRVGDIILDLYEFDPPKLNFNIEDITDTAAKSEFTRTFRIPATPNNNEFFETAFEINGQDFDVTVKIQADLYVDGNLFRQGELRLNNIYITRENERIDYEVIFFGSVRTLATSIGEGTLNQLNLTGYNHTITTQKIVDSWQAYPQTTGATEGFFNGDIVYPLVNFGNTYINGTVTPVEGEITHANAAHSKPFTNSSYALAQERFKPWIRAKVILDAIFSEAGFTYTSNFIDSDLFRNLYVAAHGNTATIFNGAFANNAKATGSGNSDGEDVFLSNIIFDYGPNFNINNRYVAPDNGTYNIKIGISGFGNLPPALEEVVTDIILVKDDGVTETDIFTVTDTSLIDSNGNFVVSIFDTTTPTLNSGDILFLRMQCQGTLTYTATFEVLSSPGVQSISSLLPEDYKKLDFIKDLITKFRLVIAPDKDDSSNFIIEPWESYIATGDLFDWTKKLDVSKDFKIQPLFNTQKSQIQFNDQEGEDYYNNLYQQQFDEAFGTLRVFSDNELLEGKRNVETNIIPTVVAQIRGSEEANNGMDNTIIPKFMVQEGEKFDPVVSGIRFAYYNGIKSTGTSAAREDTWYIQADGGGTTGFTSYAMISPYSQFPVSASTIDINWQREQGYIKYNLHDENVGSSVYNRYWSNYINSLYDKWARRVTAYFVLNAEDLINFSYSDIIFIKDAYYYVEKIYDVPMGEKASVKVDLIKLLDNTPRGSSPTRVEPFIYTIDTTLMTYGDTRVGYPPDMYRNVAFSAETTDATYYIDWGDGTFEALYFNDSPTPSPFTGHTYPVAGKYTIQISVPENTEWRVIKLRGAPEEKDVVTKVIQWGNQIGQIATPFRIELSRQDFLTSVPNDLDITNIDANGIGYIDVFNEGMFYECDRFTGSVTNFTTLPSNLKGVFFECLDYNENLSGWDVSNVTDMSYLFGGATIFNNGGSSGIGNWNVSGVTNMEYMFSRSAFNQDIGNWDVSSCTNMSIMFSNCPFNQDISSWDVSNVTNMFGMFTNGAGSTSYFNQPLNSWDVSSVTDMAYMFWNKVGESVAFNQPLDSWDTSNVTTMEGMFTENYSFNQSLGNWNIRSVTNMVNMLDNCGMSTANYDATLIGWEGAAVVPTGVTLGATNLTYTLGGAAEAARTSLISTYGWTINGDTGV